MGERKLTTAGRIRPAVLTASVLALFSGFTAWAQAPALITSAVNPNLVTTLAGNTRPEATSQNDLGPVPGSLPLEHLMLQLRRSAAQEQALAQLIEQQHDPSSRNFHQWLTAQEFGQRFGLSQQDLTTITTWLKSNGFTVNMVYPSGVLIDFSGTAEKVQAAFGAEIHNLSVNGEAHIANMSDPWIPAALAPAVVGIASLNDFRPRQMKTERSNYTVGSSQIVVPADLATIYNLNPLFQQGITGVGQTVAVIEDTDINNAADWTTFRTTFGLNGYPGTFTTVHPSCGAPGVTNDEDEAILDAEWASAAAPGAAIQLVSCAGSQTTFGGLLALQGLFAHGAPPPPSIISLSYGECEVNNSAANAFYNSTFQQAVTQGVSVFVSAGDSGAALCDSGSEATHGIGVNGFASTPYNVAVGGTDFGDTYADTSSTYWSSSNSGTFGSALSYVPEIPWNDSCGSMLLTLKRGFSVPYGLSGFCNSGSSPLTVVAGSGGPSSCATGSGATCAGYGKPSWQSGFAGIVSDGVRDLPDVSLFAANGTWGHYYVYCDSRSASCSGAPNTWSGAGGTSFSSPILAGIQALVNQKAGGAQGNPNVVYYSLAAAKYGSSGDASCNSTNGNGVSSSCIFYDVTLGDMDVNCTGSHNCYLPGGSVGVLSTSNSSYAPAFGTTTGWDFATGIGTINANNLVNNWPGSSNTTYTISGQVTLSGSPLSGVTITLSGASNGSTSTNVSGNYSFAGLAAGGTYAVTPSLAGFSFSPSNLTFSSLSSNQTTANFTASASSASQITIQTIPSGLQFTVDGGFPQTAPETVSLPSGPHTIAVATTQGDGAGTQDIFQSWSDGKAASHSINVNGSATYTATFQVQYQLTISAAPAAGGSVTPASGVFYNTGTVVPVSATAGGGFVFANWSGNVANTGNPSTSVTMNAPQTVTANFTSQPNVTIQTNPSGLLFTVDNQPAMQAPQTLSLSLGPHTIAVATTQNPSAGTQDIFDSWSDSKPASHSINVTGPATFTATFQAQYQLTVLAAPPSGGSVTPTSGIFYNAGTVVAINATANSGNIFSNWSGNVANPQIASTSVTMNSPETVTANFTQIPSVTIQTSPTGLQFSVDNGPVMLAPQTLSLTTGQHTLAVASTQSGGSGTQYIFNTWSDSNGQASRSINVTGPATYTATFQTQYQLTVLASPPAGGSVTPTSGVFYNAGSVVALNATTGSGYNFANWSGSVNTAGNASTTVTMNAPQTVTANFALIPALTIQTVPTGLQFTLDGGTPQTAPQTIVVTAGAHTIAVASSQSGGAGTQYIFSSWNDSNSATSRSVNVNGPVTYTASYQAQYRLTIAAAPAAGGTVTPASGVFYNAGSVVPVNATASSGYTFANWSGSVANTTIASTSVTMSAPETVTANFSLPACSFSLNTTSVSLPAAGTSTGGFYPSTAQSFALNAGAACSGVSWSAATADVSPAAATPSMFVSLTSASGTGAGTISFNAFSNTHQAARSATITITPTGGAPLVFTVNEAGSPQSVLTRETDALYQRSLGREPDTGGFTFWTCTTPVTVNPCSNLGVSGLGQMVDQFLQSPEGMSSDFQVLAVYQAFLGRLPSFAEWFNAVAPFRVNDTAPGWNAAAAALINTLINSSEYAGRFGSPGNTNNVINNLYQSLLRRAPTGPELTNGAATVASSGLIGLFTTVFNGAEFRNTGAFASSSPATDHSNSLFVTMIYFAVLARDPDPGGYGFWVGVANSGGAGIYFQPAGSTGANIRFQVEGPGAPNQGLVGSPEFQNLFAN